jgi:hypothetical protein
MVNQEHLDILKRGVKAWNQWRKDSPDAEPDLSGANLSGAKLYNIDLSRANLEWTDLSSADLGDADLIGATFKDTNLSMAKLHRTNLSDIALDSVDLTRAILVETDLTGAKLTNCWLYGTAIWDVELEGAQQSDLIITHPSEPTITVENLEVAQFIYLLLNNKKIRDAIDTVAKKAVLILGRFTPERKAVLDALRNALRLKGYASILFDFDKPSSRDFTETIMTLAGLSCFIIADITNPKSSPLELQATVPNYMIPFVPLIQEGEQPFSMFQDLKGKYDWVLDTLVYDTPSNLIKGLELAVIQPALEKRAELLAKKVEQLRMRHIGEYL